MGESPQIPLILENIAVLKKSHVAFCNAIKTKFGCTAVIHHVDLSTASSFGSAKRTIIPEEMYSKQLSNGLKISVWKDDLTTHSVDAVVNAANEYLNHGGGLALALSKAGGPEFQRSSDEIIRRDRIVFTGTAVLGEPGNLPCKHVLHAVGPQLSLNPSKEEIKYAMPLLDQTIKSIIQLTEFHNLQSVAIPALSSGIFNFPRELCADIIVNCVKMFSGQRRAQHKLDIRLVNNDDPSVREMVRACNKFLGQSDSHGGAAQSQSNTPTRSVQNTLELGNVTLHLKKGSIEQEQSDVIVNTIASDLNLSQGYVSKAILEKAGRNIQADIKKRVSGFASYGDVIKTSGYRLNCQEVFHTVCPYKSSSANQVFHQMISRCLEMTKACAYSSISFPAIGTGHIGFKNEEAAQIMTSAVVDFAKTYNGRKMNIYFVIFPKDNDKFKAFEKEMASAGKTMNPTKVSSSTSGKKSVGAKVKNNEESGETPYIELIANSHEALREAKVWAMGMLHMSDSVMTIINNHVIQFGQQDHKKLMSLQDAFNVIIVEFFREGKCGISITGKGPGLCCAALEVEAMLCQAQENFAQDEENELLHSVVRWQGFPGCEEPEISGAVEKAYLAGQESTVVSVKGQEVIINFKLMKARTNSGDIPISRMSISSGYSKLPHLAFGSYERLAIDSKSFGRQEKERLEEFEKCGLHIVKVEKVLNHALEQVFKLNRKRISGKVQTLYQRVPAQFCDLICRVGFQRAYATPEEQKFGAGIYFTTDVEKTKRLWKYDREEYVYIFEATVLTGKSILGSANLIVPPGVGVDQLSFHDSVTNNSDDIHVIFHGQQALPEYLITCTTKSTPV